MSNLLLSCYNEYKQSGNTSHCHISNNCIGWGCKHLRSIGFDYSCITFKFWYNFGYFEDRYCEKWLVDKEEIKRALKREIEQLELTSCSVFNKNKILSKVDSLPDEIIIDNKEWTLIENSKTKEIIGIARFADMPTDEIEFPELKMPELTFPKLEMPDLIETTDWDMISENTAKSDNNI